MDWLRADARASYGLPHGTHSTTTITGAGATARVVSDYLYRKDPSTMIMVNQKEKDSFFHSNRSDHVNRDYADRKAAQRKRDNEYVTYERMKRKLMQKMVPDKGIDQKIQLQAINQQAFQQQHLENYIQEMQASKN